jgi:hypothetical protein
VSDPEIYKRLAQLEETDRKLSNNMSDLTVEIRILVQSTQLMQKTLETLSDIKGEVVGRINEIKGVQSEVNHEFDKRISNTETAMKMVKFVGAGFVLAIIGIAATAIFGK